MSKWRVQIDVAFNAEDEVVAFANLIEGLKSKVYLFTGDIDTPTTCVYHECFHDEIPPKPCGNYKIVDFNSALVVEHKKEDGTSVSTDILVK